MFYRGYPEIGKPSFAVFLSSGKREPKPQTPLPLGEVGLSGPGEGLLSSTSSKTPPLPPLRRRPLPQAGEVTNRCRRRFLFVRFFLASLLFLASAPGALSSDRTSNDIGSDTIGQLITRQRLDEAEALCRWQLRQFNEGDVNHARWTATWSNVLAEKASMGLFAADERAFLSQLNALTQKAIAPIEKLIDSYPDSQALLFLRSQEIAVRQRILQAAIVASVVSPSTENRTDQLLVQATRIQGDTVRLAEEATQTLREYQAELKQKESAIEDHQRLIQELAVRRISLAVMQTELFENGTSDHQTSAASAVTIAKDSVLALPDGTLAQWTAKLWHVEALLRLGVATEADRILHELENETPANKEFHLQSLLVRSATIQGNHAKAKALVSEFYGHVADGSSVSGAPISPEMDFAYLSLLLSDGADPSQLANWIANIEQRGGAYARRRAESITIAALGRSRIDGTNERTPMANPALIAAQAEDLLRRNELQRAAGLLRAAALAESDSTMAFEYAKKIRGCLLKRLRIRNRNSISSRGPTCRRRQRCGIDDASRATTLRIHERKRSGFRTRRIRIPFPAGAAW